uniref:Uncharacterized protein n=1 Tax=Tanacetum cinerariifolium TaxID=118510 RepID=A0A699HWY3_TANCI|nr:hypothetical protein [Tanacetum cinerariifolium]
MREGENDMWVLGQRHMGRSGEGLGTVQVRWGCTGMAGEGVAILARKGVKEYRTYQAEEEPANFALMAISSSSSSDNEDNIIVLTNEVEARYNYIITLKQKLSQAETERDDLKLKFNKFQTSSKSLIELLANQTNGKHGLGYSLLENDSKSVSPSCPSDKVQPSGGYNALPPPIIGNFMPPKPDLVFHTAPIAVETNHLAFTVQLSPAKPAEDLSHTNRPSAPIIEEWVFDSEDNYKTTASQIAYSSVQSTKQVTPPRHSIQPVKAPILAATLNPTSPKTSSSGKRKNRKTCFVCRSVDHLIKDCNFHDKPKSQPTPRNNAHRGYNKQHASFTKKFPQKHIVLAAVLPKSKPVSVTAVRPICADVPKIMMTRPIHAHSLKTRSNSTIRRHKTCSHSLNTSNSSLKVTAAKALVVSAAKGKKGK